MTEPRGPLVGERVLDVSRSVAGAHCAKLLADLGADVVKVEPPGGDPARRHGPFPAGGDDPETSAEFLYFNTSKRSVVLDLDDPSDRSRFDALLVEYDVVVAEGPEPPVGLAALRAVNPDVVLVTVSGFGSSGPL